MKLMLSLVQKFSILCFVALAVFGFALGAIITYTMEKGMLNRAMMESANIVEQNVKKHFGAENLQSPATGDSYGWFEKRVEHMSLGANIKEIKLWNAESVVVWADERKHVGKQFRDNRHLRLALDGQVMAEISSSDELKEKYAGEQYDLAAMELYVPIRFTSGGEVAAVAEVYEDISALVLDISRHKKLFWSGLIIGFSFLFLVLFGIVYGASRQIEAQRLEIEDLSLRTVSAMAAALDAKSPWTHGHSERVGSYAERIGTMMGFSSGEIRTLQLAGILHDIGKIGTYDYLLDKPGKLTAEEYEVVKRHPEQGEKILSGITQLREVIPMIKHHHERFDGSGYPEGLAGEAIPLGARIIHVVDTYEALVDDRPYRPGRSITEAVKELKAHSGTQFDPRVLNAFLRVLEAEGLFSEDSAK